MNEQQPVNEQNTVDVSAERIASEWNVLLTEATGMEATPEPEQDTGPKVQIGAEGFRFPELESAGLCCMAADWLADEYAPNWRAHGLDRARVEKIGKPAGYVLDKYLERWFPGMTLSELFRNYGPEIALLMALANLRQDFRDIPRYTEEQKEKVKKRGGFLGLFRRAKHGDA